jgi:multisubunit Na+/H+ antiporter MnhF subunit
MIKITMGIIVIAIVIFVIRLIMTRDVYDKLMTLNLLTIKILLFLAVYSAFKRDVFILDLVMTSSLIGFIATAILIIYFGRNGSHE